MRGSAATSGVRRRSLKTLALFIGVVVTLATNIPSAMAEGTPGGGQHKLVKRTARVSVDPSGIQRTLSQARARRADGTVASGSQALPYCYMGSTDPDTGVRYPGSPPKWEYIYTWWYDSVTRLTETAQATWEAEVQCGGMSYVSISSNQWFRGQPVQAGRFESCGDPNSSVDNGCGWRQTDGVWLCAGVGNCNGNAWQSHGWTWLLPAGWEWVGLPNNCTVLFAREAICSWSTPGFMIPFAN